MRRPATLFLAGLFLLALLSALLPLATFASQVATPEPTPQLTGRIATAAELEAARAEWSRSEHAHTYDEGMGANSTCARCKSPANWDPSQSQAQEMALDCGSCKRVPGEPRPELSGGVPVAESDWQHITCDVCHVPVGDSYDVGIAFWNQALGRYESVADSTALCAHCHEGQHGFRVIEEQEATTAHSQMTCTECHGAHGAASSCTDCHDPQQGPGAAEHARHPSVHCSGCHDSAGLTIWQDPDPDSAHYGQYITRRFAHTLTSWPSHELAASVECVRCHHPPDDFASSVVPEISCTVCHEHKDGAVSLWCELFPQDPSPLPPTPSP